MTIPEGEYRYEIRLGKEILALERAHLSANKIVASRSVASGGSQHEIEALLNPDGFLSRIDLRYARGPFSRRASYRTDDELLRGSISAMAGESSVETKLGRFREVDADFIIFKALVIAHVRQRGMRRWTGRVALIDPTTLMARSSKQTYYQEDSALNWVVEPAIGERERLEIGGDGRVARRIDLRGFETVLIR
jgi:hypothetical protein